uniref:Uncharacterized protein n=1 Tax=Neobodo designis TaxID=312471 RepID=A0A7S1PJM2_NEODS
MGCRHSALLRPTSENHIANEPVAEVTAVRVGEPYTFRDHWRAAGMDARFPDGYGCMPTAPAKPFGTATSRPPTPSTRESGLIAPLPVPPLMLDAATSPTLPRVTGALQKSIRGSRVRWPLWRLPRFDRDPSPSS